MPLTVLTQYVVGPFSLPLFVSFALQHLLFTQHIPTHFRVKESLWLRSHFGARQNHWSLTSPWIGCQTAGATVRDFHKKFGVCDRYYY